MAVSTPFCPWRGSSWAEIVGCCWDTHRANLKRGDAILTCFQKYEAPLTCCRASQHQPSGGRASVGTCCSFCLHLIWCPTIRGWWSRKSWTFLQEYPVLTWLLKPTSGRKLPNSQTTPRTIQPSKKCHPCSVAPAWQRKPNASSLQCILIPAIPVTHSGISSLVSTWLVLTYMWANSFEADELCLPVSLEW